MIQKEIADKINISGKTISKWERGFGCPDVCLLGQLSEISCCGRKLEALATTPHNETHIINVSEVENGYYITMKREFLKCLMGNFMCFVMKTVYLSIRLTLKSIWFP